MMFPIGLSIIAHLSRTSANKAQVRRYALAMMLITSFGPSIGGMGTPVGTPPNLIGIGMLEKIVGQRISFFSWMAIGVPIVAMLFAYLITQFYFSSGTRLRDGGGEQRSGAPRAGTAKATAGQRNVLIAFAVTILLWIVTGRDGHRRALTIPPFAAATPYAGRRRR